MGYVTAKRKIRRHENNKSKFRYVFKWNGVISIAILHFTNLVLIYFPIYYVFPAFQTMIGQRVEENCNDRVYAMVAYATAIFPFLGLMLAYHRFGRRWAKLEPL